MADNGPLLSLEGVTKRFGSLVVADTVTLDLPRGQALGIIGPNGAGKSTLLNLIAGNLAPDQGQIRLNGRDVTGTSLTLRCRMGMGRAFQIPQTFSQLTVFETLLVAASQGRGISESEAAEDCVSILERTGLLDRANQVSGSLNLLQRKRLELARALATGPDLLLLDEIAGGLTEAECTSLVATIKELHAGGTTIVWIEHVLHALNSVVERLIVLDFGRVIQDGTPDTVMASREVQEIYLGIEA